MSTTQSMEESQGSVVGDGLSAAAGRWSFAGSTAEHFDSHVERSVPRYREGHQLVVELSDYFVLPGTTVLEIGCSTAALTEKIARQHSDRGVSFVGIDVEADMIATARERCAGLQGVELLVEDAVSYDPGAALDFVVAYYTIQFIAPRDRQRVIDAVFANLSWGGAFVMFEKVRAPDARFQDIMTQLYTDYKLTNGYSPDEVIGKTRSLKGVLEPFSSAGNLELLARAGFKDVMTIMKTVSFEGFLAIK
jgi:tRNA (cmo5U34)-methyltransferase